MSIAIEAGKWYELVPCSSILFVLHILRSNYFIPSFSARLPRPAHRFYENCWYQYWLYSKQLEKQCVIQIYKTKYNIGKFSIRLFIHTAALRSIHDICSLAFLMVTIYFKKFLFWSFRVVLFFIGVMYCTKLWFHVSAKPLPRNWHNSLLQRWPVNLHRSVCDTSLELGTIFNASCRQWELGRTKKLWKIVAVLTIRSNAFRRKCAKISWKIFRRWHQTLCVLALCKRVTAVAVKTPKRSSVRLHPSTNSNSVSDPDLNSSIYHKNTISMRINVLLQTKTRVSSR